MISIYLQNPPIKNMGTLTMMLVVIIMIIINGIVIIINILKTHPKL